MPQFNNPTLQAGYNLVSLLMTVAVFGILVTVVIPSLSKLIASNRVITEINSLTTHLHLARSEAIKRGYRAVLCSSADGSRCLGAKDWNQGYMVFIDKDADRQRDADESVIHFRSLAGNLVRLEAGRRKTVAYQPSGWAPGSNLTFTVCDADGRVPPRAVVVSDTGRPRSTHVHPNGGPLSCS